MKQITVSYDISKLKPVTNEISFDQHFNQIYKDHVVSYNSGTGDIPFNKAGAFLHELYFENIREARPNNLPLGRADHVIALRYGSFDNFVKTLCDQVERLQGSGWVFMNHAGYINIIPNNRIVDNVVLLIDCWEHAYIHTHGTDRSSYIRQHLSIINWDVVNKRIQTIADKKKEE
jgi:superoxide dismutase